MRQFVTGLVCMVAMSHALQTVHGQPPVTSYFPMEVGLRWEYDSQFKRLLGTPQKSTATTEIKEQKEVRGNSYFSLQTTVEDTPIGDYTEELYYRPGKYGILRTTPVDRDETSFLPFEVKIGDKWESVLAGKNVVFEALAFEDVTGADGTVYKKCLKVSCKSEKGSGVNDTTWLAPNVGVVKKSIRRSLYSIEVHLRQLKKVTSTE